MINNKNKFSVVTLLLSKSLIVGLCLSFCRTQCNYTCIVKSMGNTKCLVESMIIEARTIPIACHFRYPRRLPLWPAPSPSHATSDTLAACYCGQHHPHRMPLPIPSPPAIVARTIPIACHFRYPRRRPHTTSHGCCTISIYLQ